MFSIKGAYPLERQQKEENSIIFFDHANEDINHFILRLFKVLIEEASIEFLSKNTQKWRSYVVFAESPFSARPLAVVKICRVPLDRFY